MVTINDNHMMYGFWDMGHGRQNFLSFWTFFCPFTPLTTQPNNPKNQNSEKMKKTPRDIIILNMFTINCNHMTYGSWDIEHDRPNCLLFWTIFSLFTLLKTQKIKILKKWKKAWRYYHFTQVYQKSWSYAILFPRYGM